MQTKINSLAREKTLHYLYKCEIEQIYFYSESQLELYCEDFQIPPSIQEVMKELASGVFGQLQEIDQHLRNVSKHWSLERMPFIDRCLLRIATFELLSQKIPLQIIINEAIEFAKRYGTENSGKFVNGVLDSLATHIKIIKN